MISLAEHHFPRNLHLLAAALKHQLRELFDGTVYGLPHELGQDLNAMLDGLAVEQVADVRVQELRDAIQHLVLAMEPDCKR